MLKWHDPARSAAVLNTVPVNNKGLLLYQIALSNDDRPCLCYDPCFGVNHRSGTCTDSNKISYPAVVFKNGDHDLDKTNISPMVTSPLISLSTHTTAPAAILALRNHTDYISYANP